MYCVQLYLFVLCVIVVVVRTCCLAEKGLFYLLPHVPMVHFDHLPWWFVVVVARLCAVVCVLTTYDCTFLGDFFNFRFRVDRNLLLCM